MSKNFWGRGGVSQKFRFFLGGGCLLSTTTGGSTPATTLQQLLHHTFPPREAQLQTRHELLNGTEQNEHSQVPEETFDEEDRKSVV